MSVIEAKLPLVRMDTEGMDSYPLALDQTEFGRNPERLNAVYAAWSTGKLVFSMLEFEFYGIADIH